VGRLLPVLGAALQQVAAQVPGLAPVVPVAGPVADAVRQGVAAWPVRPILVDATEEKYDAFAASAAALTKSGTSTLELALAGVPMVVAYRVNPLSAEIARRLVKIRYASILNLLAEREVVPELLQESCTPGRLAEVMVSLLTDPARAAAQRAACREVLASLRPEDGLLPSDEAAEAVLELLADGGGRASVS
jgi:lipid-A-disaccharide synthase